MANPESSDAFEKLLMQTLQRAVDFLRFAEAKNAALLTLSSALTIALGNLLLNNGLSGGLKLGLWIVMMLVMVAGLIAITAFIPRLNLAKFLGGKPAGPHPKNLLYFGDIATLTIKDYKAMIEERYGLPGVSRMKPAYLDDLLVQVLVNSQITDCKMRVFRAGAMVMAAASIVAAITVTVWGIRSLVASKLTDNANKPGETVNVTQVRVAYFTGAGLLHRDEWPHAEARGRGYRRLHRTIYGMDVIYKEVRAKATAA